LNRKLGGKGRGETPLGRRPSQKITAQAWRPGLTHNVGRGNHSSPPWWHGGPEEQGAKPPITTMIYGGGKKKTATIIGYPWRNRQQQLRRRSSINRRLHFIVKRSHFLYTQIIHIILILNIIITPYLFTRTNMHNKLF
jgi:hypothetical protein